MSVRDLRVGSRCTNLPTAAGASRRAGRLGRRGVVLVVLGALMALAPTAYAATITVNTLDNELNSDGDCSLREAIEAANANAMVDACPAGHPDPTVDVIAFGVTGTITRTSGEFTVTDDLTIDGPGAASLTLSGGNVTRVMEVGPGVTLNLEGVTVADGMEYFGPGISNAGTLTVTNSTFSGNTATVTGGGIYNAGTLTVANSTFSGNSSEQDGGGVANFGTLTVTNSSFSGNTASVFGGGIETARGSRTTVTNSTFSGNSSGESGGGILNFGTLTLRNTIVADSTSGGNCSGPIIDGGGNLQYPGASCGGTISSANPRLDPAGLQDNGGPTQTIALQPGSPAIDTAVAANCPPTDQRGIPRPQGPRCDIGAFELDAAAGADLAVSVADAPDPVPASQNVTYTVVVTNNGESQATGVTLVDTTTRAGTVRSITTNQGTCTVNLRSGRVDCALGSLVDDSSATVKVVVRRGGKDRVRSSARRRSAETSLTRLPPITLTPKARRSAQPERDQSGTAPQLRRHGLSGPVGGEQGDVGQGLGEAGRSQPHDPDPPGPELARPLPQLSKRTRSRSGSPGGAESTDPAGR